MNQGKIDFEQNLKLAIRLTGIKNVIPSILIVMITIILLSKIPFRNVFVPTDITDLSILCVLLTCAINVIIIILAIVLFGMNVNERSILIDKIKSTLIK